MRSIPLAAVLTLSSLLVACGAGESAATTDAPPAAEAIAASVDYDAVAGNVVRNVASIREGDRVLIYGNVRDMELLESLAVQTRAAGAFPAMSAYGPDLLRRLYDEVPARYDTQVNEFDLELTEILTAMISVDFAEAEDLLAGVPPERIAARAEANAPIAELAQRRGVKSVNLGNGLYPSESNARRLGLPTDELEHVFWAAVGADPSALRARGEAVRTALDSGSELHITHSNGTDLRARIDDRPILISDGLISPEDEDAGGAAVQVWLPAGEVYVTPVPGTAQGTIVVDKHDFQGEAIEALTLTFDAGKLTEMTAETGIEALQAAYTAAGPGKDEFAAIDFGLNPELRTADGAPLRAWVPAGNVTVGLGNNLWAGGDNSTAFGLFGHLTGATVRVDGTPIVENGEVSVNQP